MTSRTQAEKPNRCVFQCNLAGMASPDYETYYENGTVLAFRPGDGPDRSWYRVKADSNGVEYDGKVEVIRPVRAAPGPVAARPRPELRYPFSHSDRMPDRMSCRAACVRSR